MIIPISRKAKSALLVALVCAACLSAAEPSEDLKTLLPQLTAQQGQTTLALELEVSRTSSGFKGDHAQIDQRLADLRKRMLGENTAPNPMEVEATERTLRAVRDSYEKGSTTIEQSTLILGVDYSAYVTATIDASGRSSKYWEVRRGDMFYSLHEQNQMVVIMNKAVNRREDQVEKAMNSVGLLGRLPEDLVKRGVSSGIFSNIGGVPSIRVGDDVVTLQRGAAAGKFVVSSFGSNLPEIPQSLQTTFNDYTILEGIWLPRIVKVSFSNSEYDISETYKVLKVETDLSNRRIPFINAEFGLTSVHDNRFSPGLIYKALSILPSDLQVAEWRADPALLRRHNETLSKVVR